MDSHLVIFHPVSFTLENSSPVKNEQWLRIHRYDQILQLRFIFANGIFLTSFKVLIFANYYYEELHITNIFAVQIQFFSLFVNIL